MADPFDADDVIARAQQESTHDLPEARAEAAARMGMPPDPMNVAHDLPQVSRMIDDEIMRRHRERPGGFGVQGAVGIE